MSEVTALIAEIRANGLLRAGNRLEELYAVATRIEADYAELKAQRDALAAENAALKSAFAIAKEGLQEHYDTDGVDSQDSEGNFVDACIRLCDAQSTIEKLEEILTPATDAYLNSVRAEGVEMLADNHQRIVDTLNGDSIFADGERRHSAIAAAAVYFAAQLRAGESS